MSENSSTAKAETAPEPEAPGKPETPPKVERETWRYIARRTAQGLQKKDIIRCLKRYVAREVFRAMTCADIPRIDLVQAA